MIPPLNSSSVAATAHQLTNYLHQLQATWWPEGNIADTQIHRVEPQVITMAPIQLEHLVRYVKLVDIEVPPD